MIPKLRPSNVDEQFIRIDARNAATKMDEGVRSTMPAGKLYISLVITRSKIVALVIALSYVLVPVALAGWDTRGVSGLCLLLVLPLVFIWFPDAVSEFTRFLPQRSNPFNQEVPEPVLTLLGWLGLLGYLPLLFYLLYSTS